MKAPTNATPAQKSSHQSRCRRYRTISRKTVTTIAMQWNMATNTDCFRRLVGNVTNEIFCITFCGSVRRLLKTIERSNSEIAHIGCLTRWLLYASREPPTRGAPLLVEQLVVTVEDGD